MQLPTRWTAASLIVSLAQPPPSLDVPDVLYREITVAHLRHLRLWGGLQARSCCPRQVSYWQRSDDCLNNRIGRWGTGRQSSVDQKVIYERLLPAGPG
jgi:hypothetical protein